LKTSDFFYSLPEELIAQHPTTNRDESRLLVYHRKSRLIEHRIFRDIVEYLKPGDGLVINTTRVIPARLFGYREDTGGPIEFVLLHRLERDRWEVILRPGKRAKIGTTFFFGNGKLKSRVLDVTNSGGRIVDFFYEGVFENILDELGNMPLPPYIHETLGEKERYQTVYAKQEGSAAAPTAGLHFTHELLNELKEKGVEIIPIILHVGLGTFRPVKVDNIHEHKMHAEYYEIPQESADRINAVKKNGGRVIAVGTTTTRTLETMVNKDGLVDAGSGWTDIFIYPGYHFKVIDALITNFHLPESTLLMLVSAFAGREEMLRVYEIAVKEKYRFFSFGDAMLIV
jgi:S-adenosylmethionine:tRNA ribosyltransferase-isomerase